MHDQWGQAHEDLVDLVVDFAGGQPATGRGQDPIIEPQSEPQAGVPSSGADTTIDALPFNRSAPEADSRLGISARRCKRSATPLTCAMS